MYNREINTVTMSGGLFHVVFVLLSLLIIIDARVFSRNPEDTRACGYDSCPKINPNKLNVHLVPHSHDDVGWLKTVDQYFYGSRQEIQKANVQSIIDTAIVALSRDPKRRFIYVETAYLWKWWQLQDEETRELVRTLINEGRLEIIGGGWSMNDEATTHYQAVIDQFTWGFRRLNDTFGDCARPKIGWQIDAFGHSREQASIMAQFGFDGLFFARLDWRDKLKRLEEKTAEFVWAASPNLGKNADLFSVVLFNHYSAPPGFCFDSLCSNEPLVDDYESEIYNIEKRIKQFFDFIKEQALHYRTNNIILTMGDDFHYQQAEEYFKSMDKLIKYTNSIYEQHVNVFYSTPSCYLKSLHDANNTWTTKTDDFFPYSHNYNSFWTGYYTSRPTLKYFERLGNNFLQIVKQLSVLSKIMDSEDLQFFREVMGVMQHHDAVTGTERQHVADDYAKILNDAIVRGNKIVSSAISTLSSKNQSSNFHQDFESCLLLNISTCEPTENSKAFVVTLYNPRSQPASVYARIPVRGRNYIVKDPDGTEIVTQIVPIPLLVTLISGRISKATRELIFRASEIPALGYKSFYVTENEGTNVTDEITQATNVSSIGNELYDISVDNAGNVILQSKNNDLRVVQSMHYYRGGVRNSPSGAYLFRPQQSKIYNFDYKGSHEVYKGPLVEELHLMLNNYVSQVVRIYKDEQKIEFEWLVGPILIEDFVPKEVIVKYSSNLASNKTFYTDSNGREMLKRVRDFRPTWNVDLSAQPVAGNYYPVTTKISLQDDEKKLRISVLNDRAQGGTSMNDGELELMLHRRLLDDDRLGVSEALNERAFGTGLIARGLHYLIPSNLTELDAAAAEEKALAHALSLRPWTLITPVKNLTFSQWEDSYHMQTAGLRKRLPANVHILTLEPWRDNQILLRLEHLFEITEANELSQPVQVHLADLFTDFDITRIREVTLGGNQWIESKRRLEWMTESNEVHENIGNSTNGSPANERALTVLLKPMEIRTFIIATRSFHADN